MRSAIVLGNRCICASLFKAISILVLLLFVAGQPVSSQMATGTILGVVKDSTGGSVPDAQVTLTNADTNATRTITTGGDGDYRVPALQPGHYNVKVEKTGFKTQTQTGIVLDVAAEIAINVSLEIGSSSQEVTVTGEAPQVNTTTSSLGGLVDDAKVAELPLNGRNFVDLALMQAGVTNDTNFQSSNASGGNWGVLFSSNGAPIRSNTFTLDGALMMSAHGNVGGAIGTTLGVDGIKEYRVITSAFSAEYGLQMGSQVVIVSKGGSNQFHGDVFEYLRNNVLDARNFFDYSYVTTGDRIPQLQRNNFGGSFGGPIKKDKTFFYGAYEGLRQRQGATIIDNVIPENCHTTLVPNPCATTAAPAGNGAPAVAAGNIAPQMLPILALYPLPNLPNNQYTLAAVNPSTVNYGQMRVDQNLSTSDSIFGRYTVQDSNNLSAYMYPENSIVSAGRDQFVTASENHVFSPSLLNTVRASFSRTNIVTANDFTYSPSLPAPANTFVPGQPLGRINISGITQFNGTSPNLFLQNIYTLSDDVYFTKGRHAFKFGVLANRIEDSVFTTTNVAGNISFSSVANFLAGVASGGNVGTVGSDLSKSTRYYTVGFYAQDDWRVLPRLTLNLGLRYEFNTSVLDTKGRNYAFRPNIELGGPNTVPGALFSNPSLHNFSPRVGFAWDVFGNGKTSIRSAFGEYYDVVEYGFIVYTGEQATPPISTLINVPANARITFPLSSSLIGTPGNALDTQQYNISQPTLLQWNLSLQQQVTPSVVVSLSYVGTRGLHLWDREEGNPCLPLSVNNGLPSWANAKNIDCPGLVNGVITQNAGRPNQTYSSANYEATQGDSWYNALQAEVTKRLSHGLEIQGAYTFAKVLDDTQGEFGPSDCTAAGSALGAYPENKRLVDKGPACFDVNQNLRVNVLYHLPGVKTDNRFVRGALNGWWAGSIMSWQTGFPFEPLLSVSRSLSDNMGSKGIDLASLGTATVAPGQTGPGGFVNTTGMAGNKAGPIPVTFIPYNQSTVITGNPQQWFNPLMFIPGPVGSLGNAARDMLRGPHLSNIDFSVNKDTPAHFLGEQGQIEFRAEFFNIFNHANFGIPAGTTYSGALTDGSYSEDPAGVSATNPLGTAGSITNTVTTSRQIQFSLKVIF